MSDPVTANYGINLPQPSDSMADVADGFNNAWPIISNAVKPNGTIAGVGMPSSGYTVGQTCYNTTWKSLFILIAIDSNWGYMWRPIHARWGPWVIVGSGVLNDTVNYESALDWFPAYRISNSGDFELAGGIKRSTPPMPNGFLTQMNPLPVGCRPDKLMQWECCMHKNGMTTNNGNYYCKLWLTTAGAWEMNVFNNASGTADADEVFFWNVKFQIADRTDL